MEPGESESPLNVWNSSSARRCRRGVKGPRASEERVSQDARLEGDGAVAEGFGTGTVNGGLHGAGRGVVQL